MSPQPERLRELKELTHEVIACQVCSKSTAATLRGKPFHIDSGRRGRTGKSVRAALNAVADGHCSGWSADLEVELRFVLASVDITDACRVPLGYTH